MDRPAIPLDLKQALLAGGAEAVAWVVVTGLPDGARLTRGRQAAPGRWTLEPEDLDGLGILPGPAAPPFRLQATAEVHHADESTSHDSALIAVDPDTASPPTQPPPVPLNLDPGDLPPGLADDDTLGVHGLPEGAELTAGGPAPDGGWMVAVGDLSGLAVTLPEGYRGRFDLGFHTDPTAGAVARLSVEVPGTAPRRKPSLNLTARLVPIRGRRPSRLEQAPDLADLGSEPADLAEAEEQKAQLRETIARLRDELETLAGGVDQAVAEAVAEPAAERDALKDKARVLRDKLEALRDDTAEAVRKAHEDPAERLAALRGEAGERRDRLEALRDDKDRQVRAIHDRAAPRIAELRQTAQGLRDDLEARARTCREEEERFRSETEDELGELRRTVVELRDDLEARQSQTREAG